MRGGTRRHATRRGGAFLVRHRTRDLDLVMEWHSRNAPAGGGRHAAREALVTAGFSPIESTAGAPHPSVGLMWGVR